MKIDRHLNIVGEFSRGDDPPLIFHATALPEDIFAQYFDLFGRTMNRLVTDGYGRVAPYYAASVLRQVALDSIPPVLDRSSDAYRQAAAAVEERVAGLFNELHRLTFAMALKDGRWDMMPIDDAKAAGALTEKEYRRIEAMLCFSTCVSESLPPGDVEGVLGGLALFNARTESSSCTEFASSLPTSMTAANSGASPAASPPSSRGSQPTTGSASTSNGSTSPASPGAPRPRTGIVITSPQA